MNCLGRISNVSLAYLIAHNYKKKLNYFNTARMYRAAHTSSMDKIKNEINLRELQHYD